MQELFQVFCEHSPPAELLMDNGASFHSQKVKDLCDGWAVRQLFCCAYQPSGNAIVERNHRTIKHMAIRAKANPLDMVYRYNISLHDGTKAESVLLVMMRRQWRCPFGKQNKVNDIKDQSEFSVGDSVYVKPPNVRCTSIWPLGKIAGILSGMQVEVNGTLQHVADIWLAITDNQTKKSQETNVTDEEHPIHERRAPAYLDDYVAN